MPMFSLFHVITFFILWENRTKYLGLYFWLAIFEIIAPFWCKKKKINPGYHSRKYSNPPKFWDFNRVLGHGLYVSAAVLYQLSFEDPYIGSRPICWVHLNPWKEWNIEIKEWGWCELRKYTFVVWCVAHDINFSRGCHYIIISHSGVCKRHCANAQGFPGSTLPE